MTLGRVLLIRLGALGDTILASSAASLLRRDHPGVRIDFLVAAGLEGLWRLLPDVDRVQGLRWRRLPAFWNPWARSCVARLGVEAYDLVYLMETDPRFLPLLSFVRGDVKLALGRDEPKGCSSDNVAAAVRYQRLLQERGWARPGLCYPRLELDERAADRARSLLVELGFCATGPIVGFHPGNSFRARKTFRRWTRRSDLRSWPEERWVELAAEIHRLYPAVQFVLFGSVRDRPVNERVRRRLQESLPAAPVASSAGRTGDLAVAASLLRQCALFVATDTGPLHMAAALGVPVIGLYGPTRFAETGPFASSPAAVVRKALSCQPCYGSERQRTCRRNRCMEEITVPEVVDAVDRMKVLPRRQGA